jgi:hypothetical protein
LKVIAAVALIVSAAAVALPASWMDVSAGAQEPAPVAVRARMALKANDDIVAPSIAVQRSAVDIPEEISLLLVGAALVGLAGMLRRDRPAVQPQPRVESARRAS